MRQKWWSRWDSNPRPSRLSPGRAHQTLDHTAVLPRLDLSFSAHGWTTGLVFFLIDQLPRPPIPERLGIVRVVVGEALFDVLRLTNVIAVCCFAQKDIDVERHAPKVVEPMGFVPTTFPVVTGTRSPNARSYRGPSTT